MKVVHIITITGPLFCEHILLKPCVSIRNVDMLKKSCWNLCAGTVNVTYDDSLEVFDHDERQETQEKAMWFIAFIFSKWSQLGAHYFLVYLFQLLYMFRATMRPSSGQLTASMRHWYFSLCNGGCLVRCSRPDSYLSWSSRSRQVAVTVSLMPDTVIWTPDDGWGYHLKHLERFAVMNKLCIAASCWIIIDTSLEENFKSLNWPKNMFMVCQR